MKHLILVLLAATFSLAVMAADKPADKPKEQNPPSSSENQEKTCKATFEKNKAAIERLAAAGNESGIRAILAKGGCPEAKVTLEKPAGNPPANARFKVDCVFEYPPLHIRCTVTW